VEPGPEEQAECQTQRDAALALFRLDDALLEVVVDLFNSEPMKALGSR
jgi:hypothetical protein